MVGGYFKRMWVVLRRPSAQYSLGALLVAGAFGGVIFWGGFNTALEATNTMSFCISCHEMRAFVYEEYKQTVHYQNMSGVRASCADCHVPKDWTPKVARKIKATFVEVPHKIIGSISTREKFQAKRLQLAERVWASMRASDSRECRNCHLREAMVLADQKPRARGQHEEALQSGETCIECHQGIAHKKPEIPKKEGDGDFAL